MKRLTPAIVAAGLALFAAGILQGQQKKTPGEGFAAVPGQKGGQDVFGPYRSSAELAEAVVGEPSQP